MSNSLRHKTLTGKPASTVAGVLSGPDWDAEHVFAGGVGDGDIVCWDPTKSDKVRVGYNVVDVINSQNNYVSNKVAPANVGTDQQIALLVKMIGGSLLANGKYRIPLAVRAETGGSDGLDGINIVVQQNSGDPVAYLNGLELGFNNLKRNDPLNPVDQNHFGLTVDAYGGFSTGPAAIAIRTGAANSNWQRGIWIPVSSITPSTGLAFAYDGDATHGPVTISVDSIIKTPRIDILGTSVTPTIGPALWNNGGIVLGLISGSDSFRFYSNNVGTELMRLSNAGALTLATYGSGGGLVSVGAADSGGAGFKLLRVPN